jgi:GNAT superfamily N-acetyltransferase
LRGRARRRILLPIGSADGRGRAGSDPAQHVPDPGSHGSPGRLAIDRNWLGKGIGAALLQEACSVPDRQPVS